MVARGVYGGERGKPASAARLQTAAGAEPGLPSPGLGSSGVDVIELSNTFVAPVELSILFCHLEPARLLMSGSDEW